MATPSPPPAVGEDARVAQLVGTVVGQVASLSRRTEHVVARLALLEGRMKMLEAVVERGSAAHGSLDREAASVAADVAAKVAVHTTAADVAADATRPTAVMAATAIDAASTTSVQGVARVLLPAPSSTLGGSTRSGVSPARPSPSVGPVLPTSQGTDATDGDQVGGARASVELDAACTATPPGVCAVPAAERRALTAGSPRTDQHADRRIVAATCQGAFSQFLSTQAFIEDVERRFSDTHEALARRFNETQAMLSAAAPAEEAGGGATASATVG